MEVEDDIIRRCARDERRAQFELYKICYPFMMRIALRYLFNRDEAASCVNESFLKVCRNIGTYRPEVPFEVWIRKITINTSIDQIRKNKKYSEQFKNLDYSAMNADSTVHNLNQIHTDINAEALRALMDQLPKVSSSVFNLCVLDGYTYPEASAMLGISEATCRWHIHFSRRRLQELLKSQFEQLKTNVL